MSNIIEARVKQKKDTLANWEANPMILLDGEQAFVVGSTGQPINFKIGDGTKTFSELPYWIQYDQAAFISVSGLALPTPSQPVGYSLLGEGTYTHSSGGFTVPVGHWGVANWDGSAWSFSDMGLMPTTPTIDVAEQGNANAISSDGVYKELKPINTTLDTITTKKNYFDKTDVIDGQLLNTSGTPAGTLKVASVAGWIMSQPIRVTKGFWTITFDGTFNIVPRLAALFNTPNVIVGSIGTRLTSLTFEVTDDEAWLIINLKSPTVTMDLDAIQVEKGQTPTPVEPFGDVKVNNDAINKAEDAELGNNLPITSDGVAKELTPLKSVFIRRNYFDKTDIVSGQLVASGGSIPSGFIRLSSAAAWSTSDSMLLPVGDYKVLGITINENSMFAGLWDEKPVVGVTLGQRISNNTFSVTGSPKYFAFSVANDTYQADIDIIQVKNVNEPDDYASFDDIAVDGSKISGLNPNPTPSEGKLSVLVQSNAVFVRSSFDENFDQVMEFQYQNIPTTNGIFSSRATYKVPKTFDFNDSITSYQVHNTNDSISPMGTDQYWFIGGQHGYYICRASSAAHPFLVGEEVVSNTGATFKVVATSANQIYLEPTITVVGESITRSWNNGSASFSSLSTLDSSKTASVSTVIGYQFKPMSTIQFQKIYINGVDVNNTGIYLADTVELVDVSTVLDPINADFDNGLTSFSSTPLYELSQSYFFKGGSVYLSSNLNMKSWLPFIKYHGIQPIGLVPSTGKTPYIMYPKVLPKTMSGRVDVDWNYPTDASNPSTSYYAQYAYAVTEEDLVDINDIPDRTIQYLTDDIANDYVIGFASGFDLESGNSSKANRGQLTGEAFSVSPNLSYKTYNRVMTSNKFPNGVIPSSFLGQFNAYMAYYKPQDNLQSYVVHAKDVSYVYIHTQAIFEKGSITVDNIEGKQLFVVEQKGVELLTDRVINGTVYIKTVDELANYIVLKTI